MAAQQGKLSPPNAAKEPKLSRAKTQEVFEISQGLTIKQMERLKTQKMPDSGDQVEMMANMMVEQAKMQDEMFFKSGVENDDFEESLIHWVSKDPEMQK